MQRQDYKWAVEQYEQGASLALLARQLGVSKSTVMCAMRRRRVTQSQRARDQWRFWQRVTKTETCWLWTGPLDDGYGSIHIGGVKQKAHRVAYEWAYGAIPDGLQLDHLCRVRRCVRPDHLEPVTHAENMRRGERAQRTHCVRGHEFTPENTYLRPHDKGRDCRTCITIRHRRRRAAVPKIKLRGELIGNHVLSAAQVLAIRAAFTGAFGQQSQMAREYGVTPQTVSNIIHRHTWRHL